MTRTFLRNTRVNGRAAKVYRENGKEIVVIRPTSGVDDARRNYQAYSPGHVRGHRS